MRKITKLEEEIIATAKVQVSHTLKGDETVWDEYIEHCDPEFDPKNNTVIAIYHVLVAAENLNVIMTIDPFVMGRCIIKVEQFVADLKADKVKPIF
ncbi:MAG: hypothetical protein KAS32_19300 [Candidatus Peribacteraceae bacterium]|nr:hypothetical protein [Candidatus Peribacteraceae bacterium]